MPIKSRIDMLTTGVRTPVGIKIFGADLARDRAHRRARSKRVLPRVPGTRSVFAERVGGGYFLDFDLKREQLARYGLTVDDAQMVVMTAIGGDNVTHHGRGPRALSDQRPLLRATSRSDLDAPAARAGACHGRQAADPAGARSPTSKLATVRR